MDNPEVSITELLGFILTRRLLKMSEPERQKFADVLLAFVECVGATDPDPFAFQHRLCATANKAMPWSCEPFVACYLRGRETRQSAMLPPTSNCHVASDASDYRMAEMTMELTGPSPVYDHGAAHFPGSPVLSIDDLFCTPDTIADPLTDFTVTASEDPYPKPYPKPYPNPYPNPYPKPYPNPNPYPYPNPDPIAKEFLSEERRILKQVERPNDTNAESTNGSNGSAPQDWSARIAVLQKMPNWNVISSQLKLPLLKESPTRVRKFEMCQPQLAVKRAKVDNEWKIWARDFGSLSYMAQSVHQAILVRRRHREPLPKDYLEMWKTADIDGRYFSTIRNRFLRLQLARGWAEMVDANGEDSHRTIMSSVLNIGIGPEEDRRWGAAKNKRWKCNNWVEVCEIFGDVSGVAICGFVGKNSLLEKASSEAKKEFRTALRARKEELQYRFDALEDVFSYLVDEREDLETLNIEKMSINADDDEPFQNLSEEQFAFLFSKAAEN